MNSRRISLEDALEVYYAWLFSQPIKRTLSGRNDRGRNIMYFHGKFGGGVDRKRKIFAMLKKGWYAHEQQMD